MKLKIFIHILIPLMLGFIIYVLFKSPTITINNYFFEITHLKIKTLKLAGFNQFKHNLPDGLWSYSLMSAIILIIGNSLNKQNLPWILIGFLLPIIFELSQNFKFIRGTYDSFDLLYSIVFSLCSIFFLTSKFFNHEKQKQF